MKRIYLKGAWRLYSGYKDLVLHPPDGYALIISTSPRREALGGFARKKFLNTLYGKIHRTVPLNLVRAHLRKFERIPEDVDLIYSSGLLVFTKKPWVVDFEYPFLLVGGNLRHFARYRRVIERAFASEYCRKIICRTEAAKKTVLSNLDCTGFEHKLESLLYATPKKDFVKSYNRGKVKLLFVGSENIPGEFELKGGREVLQAFVELSRRYDNLELVIRSDLPWDIKDKYRGTQNIRIIDKIIPWQLLEQELKSADIFLFPSYSTPGMVFLEAMSYELPIVTTDMWANPELVENGKTGFVIEKSDRVRCYGESFIPILGIPESQKPAESEVADELFMFHFFTHQIQKVVKTPDPEVVQGLVEKTSILIENEEMRREMGRRGRWEVEQGKFSTEKRNEKLKRILDEATA